MYAENKIIPRTASLRPILASTQKYLSQGLVELDGDFTFDFYFDKDRSKWFNSFDVEKTKRAHGDRFFAAKEVVVGNYIEQTKSEQFNKNIVPRSMLESPRSFLYNDLIARAAIQKNYILPALRKLRLFDPIPEYMEHMFFDFDQNSYNISIIEIPDNYDLRRIFKITFKVYFNVQKYLDHIIVKKRATFELHLWPDCYIKMKYSMGFPFVFTQNRLAFYNTISPIVSEVIRKNPAILRYIYNTIKIRLDRVTGLAMEMSHVDSSITISTTHVMSLLTQFIAGKIDIFNKNSVSSSFKIQKIEPSLVQRFGVTGSSTGAVLLMYFYALHIAGKQRPGSTANPRDIEKIMKDIKNGKIKINEVKN